MLLALADRRRAVADTLAALIADHRDPSHITHTVADVLRARMLAIGCGYPDGNDFDWLRRDVAFKLACGRLLPTARHQGSLLAADHLALGECADAAGDHPPHLRTR